METEIFALCDGLRSLPEIARELAARTGSPGAEGLAEAGVAVSAAVRRLFRLGLLETIEEDALRGVLAFHGSRTHDLRLVDICTGDYFTAVRLNDGSQGVAINFNNVSGPHRTSFNHRHYDYLLTRLLEADGLLFDTFLRQPLLDCLGQSVRVAILNALSCRMLTVERLRTEHGLDLHDGYLDLASFFRPGDKVAMIGCTGNYSCAAVGKLADLGTIYFSDFEYVEPFKAGIVDCIRRNFLHPEKVLLSSGQDNEAICGKADVVVIIADTLCTNTLDELLTWSSDARSPDHRPVVRDGPDPPFRPRRQRNHHPADHSSGLHRVRARQDPTRGVRVHRPTRYLLPANVCRPTVSGSQSHRRAGSRPGCSFPTDQCAAG